MKTNKKLEEMKMTKKRRKRNLKITSVLLAIFAVFVILNNSLESQVEGGTFEQEISHSINIPEEYKIVKVEIANGATAWDIQSTLVPNEEINEVLELVEQINGRDMSKINTGETLLFLTTNNGEVN